MPSRRQWRTADVVGITLIYAGVSLSTSAGFGLLAFGDIAQFSLLFLAFLLMSANAVSTRGQTRVFWCLMALGCLLWSADLALWTLYDLIVFPDEYVQLNVAVYSPHYDLLYLVENMAFLGVLGVLAWKARGAWKRIYWNLFVASGLYAVSSLALNVAIARGKYHTGSLYDLPFIASVRWMIWATLLARDLKPPSQPAPSELPRWQMLTPRL